MVPPYCSWPFASAAFNMFVFVQCSPKSASYVRQLWFLQLTFKFASDDSDESAPLANLQLSQNVVRLCVTLCMCQLVLLTLQKGCDCEMALLMQTLEMPSNGSIFTFSQQSFDVSTTLVPSVVINARRYCGCLRARARARVCV